MTNEEMQTIAAMVAETLSKNASQEPSDAPEIVPEAEKVQTEVDTDKIDVGATKETKAHVPQFTAKEVADVLNDVRMEVRAQFNQPWVEAINVAFQHPVAFATINGKKTPLISPEQVNAMIDSLKSSGKFWPQMVTTMLTPSGERQYINTSYKREDGKKWKEGNVLKPQAEVVQS